MTAKVIKDINTQKQLLAGPAPIDIQEWDVAIFAELNRNVEVEASSSSPVTQQSTPPQDVDEPPIDPSRHTEPDTSSQTPHKPTTKGHNRTPHKTPGKTSPPTKKKKPDPRSLDRPPKLPANTPSSSLAEEGKSKDRNKPPKKNPKPRESGRAPPAAEPGHSVACTAASNPHSDTHRRMAAAHTPQQTHTTNTRALPRLPRPPTRIVYSDQVGHQTSDIRLLWTAITQTINPPPPPPLVM